MTSRSTMVRLLTTSRRPSPPYYVYDLPFFKGQHGFEGKALGGWQVSGITSFLSGQSFSLAQPHDPWDPNGLNVGLGISSPRPDQIAAVQKLKTVGAWFSTILVCPGPQPLRQRKQWQPARTRLQRLGSGGHQKHHYPRALQLPTPRRVLQRLQPRELLGCRQLTCR